MNQGLKCGIAEVGIGKRDVINYNHDPVRKVFGHKYVSMDRPTSGLYTKDGDKQIAKETEWSESSRKLVCTKFLPSSELVNPSMITSPRTSSSKASRSTGSLHTSPPSLKP